MPSVYYNEIEPFAVEWLNNLMQAGELPAGKVDERSIKSVNAADLAGYDQCHFFAGIGGWPYALALAGWPDDAAVWTGSCPCQPFSQAGKRKGTDDARHLWPDFFRLIAECRPATIFGEQVASNDGREWLAGVRADLEALGYAVGAADLCAAGEGEEGEGWFVYGDTSSAQRTIIGSPIIRQRLWWVASAGSSELRRGSQSERKYRGTLHAPDGSGAVGLGESRSCAARRHDRPEIYCDAAGPIEGVGLSKTPIEPSGAGPAYWMGCPNGDGRRGVWASLGRSAETSGTGWSDFEVIHCTDGKSRRVERGSFPLAHGLPRSVGPGSTKAQRVELMAAKANRVGRLRGYGNAIVPQVAARFVRAFMESV